MFGGEPKTAHIIRGRFWVIYEKPQGGGPLPPTPPPSGRGLNDCCKQSRFEAHCVVIMTAVSEIIMTHTRMRCIKKQGVMRSVAFLSYQFFTVKLHIHQFDAIFIHAICHLEKNALSSQPLALTRDCLRQRIRSSCFSWILSEACQASTWNLALYINSISYDENMLRIFDKVQMKTLNIQNLVVFVKNIFLLWKQTKCIFTIHRNTFKLWKMKPVRQWNFYALLNKISRWYLNLWIKSRRENAKPDNVII